LNSILDSCVDLTTLPLFACPETASCVHLFPYSTYPYLPATQIHKPEQEAHSSLKLLQQLWPNYGILEASFSHKPRECDQNTFNSVAKGLYQMIDCLWDNKPWPSLKDLTKGKHQKIGQFHTFSPNSHPCAQMQMTHEWDLLRCICLFSKVVLA
jgi:hypothetical protein